MKKKKVYVFTKSSRAAAYGIGTYMEQYIKCFKDSDLDFGIINLSGKGKEVRIENNKGYQEIFIPAPADFRKPNMYKYYVRNAAYLLKEIIGADENVEYIFHLNFMGDHYLISALKKVFNCKVVLVAHYANWDFALNGDIKKLKTILSNQQSGKRDKKEINILNGIKYDKNIILQCDHFICVSEYMSNAFKNIIDIDGIKCSVVTNALKDVHIELNENEKAAIRKKYHIDPNTRILLYAGRLDEGKGISYIIEAFKTILKEYSDVQLVLAGDGSYTRWMKEAGACWSKINYTGRLDKKELYELYTIADIGIIASMYEAFGLVAVEMMMHQLPVIASEAGGLSEIIEDNVSGLKVPIISENEERKVDVNILTEKIKLLLDDAVFREKIAVNGRNKFLQQYELSLFREKMNNIYKNI